MTISISACVLLATNLTLTFLSIYWSVSAWSALHQAQHELPWPRTNCTVIARNTTTRSRSFRAEFLVNNFTKDTPALQGTAYRTAAAKFNETAESALAFLNTKTLNHSYPCWQSTQLRTRLSFSPVRIGVRSEHANLAAISTVLSLAAVFSLAAIIYLVFVMTPVFGFTENVAPPDPASRTGLTQDAIERLVAAAEQKHASDGRTLTEEPVCAICLEEDNGARLGCGHAFHPGCIRTWLLRGGDTCPLCCASLMPFDGDSDGGEMPADLADLPDMGRDEPAQYSSTRFPSLTAMHRAVLMADAAIMARTQAVAEIDVIHVHGERAAASPVESTVEPQRAECSGCKEPQGENERAGAKNEDGGANDSGSDSDSIKNSKTHCGIKEAAAAVSVRVRVTASSSSVGTASADSSGMGKEA